MEIISREEARVKGLKRYFTGEPCKNDHTAERLVSDKTCTECARLKRIRNADGMKKYQIEWYKKNRERVLQQQKKYSKENRDKCNEKCRRWNKANPERRKEIERRSENKRRDKRREERNRRRKEDLSYLLKERYRDPPSKRAASCAVSSITMALPLAVPS